MELDSSRWRSEPLWTMFDTDRVRAMLLRTLGGISTHHADDTNNTCMTEEKKKRLATVS